MKTLNDPGKYFVTAVQLVSLCLEWSMVKDQMCTGSSSDAWTVARPWSWFEFFALESPWALFIEICISELKKNNKDSNI